MRPKADTIYLDYAATALLAPEALAVVSEMATCPMNASSIHQWGRYSKSCLEAARQSLKYLTGRDNDGLVFTSGGTEANGLALHQARSANFGQILFSHTNHDSLKPNSKAFVGQDCVALSVDSFGIIDLDQLDQLLSLKPKSFIALSLVNHETGIIQPHQDIAKLARSRGAWLHWDGVQALSAPDINLDMVDGDSFAISAHKCGGLCGTGALVHNPNHQIVSQYSGGGQEKGARAGTENLIGILAFVEAMKAQKLKSLISLKNLEDRLMDMGVRVLGHGNSRSGHIVCIAQDIWTSQAQLIHCDMAGVCVSMGSACSSGKVKQSPVALAMGLDHLSDKVLRISIGWGTTISDLDQFFDVWSVGFRQCQHRLEMSPQREAS